VAGTPRGELEWSPEEPWPVTTVGRLRVELPADQAVCSIARERVGRWLDVRGWASDDRDDVVLAVHEALANVVDHAYRGRAPGAVVLVATIRLHAVDQAQVVVSVQDRGRWRPVPRDAGHRGHGLKMMNGCMLEVDIRPGDDGTEVVMTGRVVTVQPQDGRRSLLHDRRATINVPIAHPQAGKRRRNAFALRAAAFLQRGSRLHEQALTAALRAERLIERAQRAGAHADRVIARASTTVQKARSARASAAAGGGQSPEVLAKTNTRTA
jgi:serine/threonine-protein kinase RsbW